MNIEREKENAMNIDLGQIILAFAAYYSVLALLIVSLFSAGVWGTVKYVKRLSAQHREPSEMAGSRNNRQDFISPSATLAT